MMCSTKPSTYSMSTTMTLYVPPENSNLEDNASVLDSDTELKLLTMSPSLYPHQFLNLPYLEGQDFSNLVNDIKWNSRLPLLGKELLNPISHPNVRHSLDVEVHKQHVNVLSCFSSFKNFPAEIHGSTQTSTSLDNLLMESSKTANKTTSCVFPTTLSAPSMKTDGTLVANETNFADIERTLVMDLLLIFQGCNGSILQWDENNRFAFHVDENLLHPSHKSLSLRMCPIGVCYKMIKSQLYVPTRGKCFDALKSFFQAQLREFHLMVLSLEQLMQGHANDVELEKYQKIVPFGSHTISLHQLECLMFDSKKLLKAMTNIISHIKPESKGGDLCSVLHEFTQHGDPDIQDFAYRTLAYVARPLYKMIGNWIFIGNFHDKYNEFFITVDSSVPPENMWREKFTLKKEMIPSFISLAEANLIFRAGKNLNFLIEVCKSGDAYKDKSRFFQIYKDIDIEQTLREQDTLFQDIINTASMVTSDLVLKEVLTYERLFEHLHTIKYYILQGQGDFFQLFVNKVKDDLMKPARVMNTLEFQATLQHALFQATHVATKDYLERLFVTRSPFGDEDQIWDVLCLEYKASQCLRQIFTLDTMTVYSRVFSFLWDTRRAETLLTTIWVDKKIFNIKLLRTMPEISVIIFKNNNLLYELNNFIHQLRFYAMFEAVETQWQKLMNDLTSVTCLDDVIAAHEEFIDILGTRCLQHPKSFEILMSLQAIYSQIYKFEKYHTRFCEQISYEYARRLEEEASSSKSTAKSDQLKEFIQRDFQCFIKESVTAVDNFQKTSHNLIQSFLVAVENYVDDTYTNIYISGMGYRVDFNDFYSQKNPKLSEARTFLHRRRSNSNLLNSQSVTDLSLSIISVSDVG